jgi:hypothetical protein
MLRDPSILVVVQPAAGLSGAISPELKAKTLAVLGQGFKDNIIMLDNAESLSAAMLRASTNGNKFSKVLYVEFYAVNV